MKRISKILIVLAMSAGVSFHASAQTAVPWEENPDYGATLEERENTVMRLNLLRDAFTVMNDHDAALEYVRQIVRDTPKASVLAYDYGIRIYKSKIPFATNMAQKEAYVDSMSMLYDLWADNLGDRGTQAGTRRPGIKANKAYDYYSLMPSRRTRVRDNFRHAVREQGKDVKVELLKSFFKVVVDDYAIDSVDTDHLLAVYDEIYTLMEDTADEGKAQGLKDLDALLVQSNALSCEKLEELYKPRYEANPNDVELMKKIVSAFVRIKCNSDFQMMVAENYYKAAPSPETAAVLAKTFEDRQEYDKSLFYLREAIDGTADITLKAGYVVRAGASALGSKNYRQAIELARQAISINPADGMAHYLLAQAYMESAAGCSDNVFAQQSVFWLATDQLNEAKRLLAGDNVQLSQINQSLARCRSNYPSDEALFERSLSEGERYNVNCGWVAGTTTIRKK